MATDYYATLGLKKAATSDEIHKAYRELARKYHPDLHPDDTSAKKKFQEVQAAFDVLNDPKKRALYDQYGPGFEQMGGAGGSPFGSGSRPWPGSSGGSESFHFDFEDLFGQAQQQQGAGSGGFADFFRQFTGGGRGRPGGAATGTRPMRGDHIEHDLTVPFATAALGGQAQIAIQRPDGRTETITVKIPAGIEDGKKIRLRGQGEVGPRGAKGDLLIRVHVSEHPCFRRRGKQLEVTVPVTLAEAIAGAKIDVPTPHGTITLQIPPGTSSGKKLRIKGHGIAAAGKIPGDLYAEVQIVLPEKINESDRNQLADLARKYATNPRGNLRW